MILREKYQANPTVSCPSCNRMPFGVMTSMSYFCGEFIEEFSCGSCRFVVGISVAPRGPIGGSYIFAEWDRLVRKKILDNLAQAEWDEGLYQQ